MKRDVNFRINDRFTFVFDCIDPTNCTFQWLVNGVSATKENHDGIVWDNINLLKLVSKDVENVQDEMKYDLNDLNITDCTFFQDQPPGALSVTLKIIPSSSANFFTVIGISW